MNIEATEPTSGFSPAAIRRSTPRRYASAAATYCSRENSKVTLIGTPAKIASSMAGRPSLVPGILMKRLGRPARAWRALGRGEGAGRVVGQQGRDLQRDPSVHTVGLIVDRPKQIGGLPEVVQRQLEEQRLARLAFLQFLADGVVVVVTVLEGVVEDRGVRGEPRDRELLDVAAERAAGQQTAGDVVEPEALAHFVEFLGRFHQFSRDFKIVSP